MRDTVRTGDQADSPTVLKEGGKGQGSQHKEIYQNLSQTLNINQQAASLREQGLEMA